MPSASQSKASFPISVFFARSAVLTTFAGISVIGPARRGDSWRKSQNARTRALRDFKSGKTLVLVATDIAARGLDIEQLPVVINFDLPTVAEDYVHRIGRTGPAGAEGQAVSLVSHDEMVQAPQHTAPHQNALVAGF